MTGPESSPGSCALEPHCQPPGSANPFYICTRVWSPRKLFPQSPTSLLSFQTYSTKKNTLLNCLGNCIFPLSSPSVKRHLVVYVGRTNPNPFITREGKPHVLNPGFLHIIVHFSLAAKSIMISMKTFYLKIKSWQTLQLHFSVGHLLSTLFSRMQKKVQFAGLLIGHPKGPNVA